MLQTQNDNLQHYQKQIEALQREIVQYKQNEKRLKFRRGDCIQVKVMSLEYLPSSFQDMETYVMISLDGRNQVYHTSRRPGQTINYEEEFLCELNEDSTELVIMTYSGKPSVAAELLGTTVINLDSADFGHTKELTKKIQINSDEFLRNEHDESSTITLRVHKFNHYKAKVTSRLTVLTLDLSCRRTTRRMTSRP